MLHSCFYTNLLGSNSFSSQIFFEANDIYMQSIFENKIQEDPERAEMVTSVSSRIFRSLATVTAKYAERNLMIT